MNSTAMEQRAKYKCSWGVWGARRSSSSAASPIPWAAAAYGGEPSWEEQAFARDAAANLGGSVWPPRSYSCSFCQREFRSAQALGGHMNVHRRDRARLRQCSSPPDEAPPHGHDHQPHQDTFLYKPTSNPRITTTVSAANKGDLMTTPSPSYLSTIIKEGKSKVLLSMAVREEAIHLYDDDEEEEEESNLRSRKRRRVDDQPLVALPIFMLPAAAAPLAMVAPCEEEGKLLSQRHVDRDAQKVHKTTASPSSSSALEDRQEVDLELRLGTTPKVT